MHVATLMHVQAHLQKHSCLYLAPASVDTEDCESTRAGGGSPKERYRGGLADDLIGMRIG